VGPNSAAALCKPRYQVGNLDKLFYRLLLKWKQTPGFYAAGLNRFEFQSISLKPSTS
jgi:hypothetical protein